MIVCIITQGQTTMSPALLLADVLSHNKVLVSNVSKPAHNVSLSKHMKHAWPS